MYMLFPCAVSRPLDLAQSRLASCLKAVGDTTSSFTATSRVVPFGTSVTASAALYGVQKSTQPATPERPKGQKVQRSGQVRSRVSMPPPTLRYRLLAVED